ncbi:MAG: hypothetical protein QF535_10205 [Anaerolineales bacterium]|nr:hypothetical protein [Anaerolineales bacterium]
MIHSFEVMSDYQRYVMPTIAAIKKAHTQGVTGHIQENPKSLIALVEDESVAYDIQRHIDLYDTCKYHHKHLLSKRSGMSRSQELYDHTKLSKGGWCGCLETDDSCVCKLVSHHLSYYDLAGELQNILEATKKSESSIEYFIEKEAWLYVY